MRLRPRINSIATGSFTFGSEFALELADAVLGRDRTVVFKHDLVDGVVDLAPALEELRAVGANRLADIEMHVAVAEMAERHRPRSRERWL